MNDFVQAVGLLPDKSGQRLTEDQLFSEMHDVFSKEMRVTTQQWFGSVSKFNSTTYRRRWGEWNSTLAAFRRWLLEHDPESPLHAQLLERHSSNLAVIKETAEDVAPQHAWRPKVGRQYGEVINFRGLLHAPTNEQELVFLFGMVARELGFIVESVTEPFPDCEAKRLVRKVRDRWQRVLIEFGFESRNFRDHGHDPAGCDLIVCWVHNWQECRIEDSNCVVPSRSCHGRRDSIRK